MEEPKTIEQYKEKICFLENKCFVLEQRCSALKIWFKDSALLANKLEIINLKMDSLLVKNREKIQKLEELNFQKTEKIKELEQNVLQNPTEDFEIDLMQDSAQNENQEKKNINDLIEIINFKKPTIKRDSQGQFKCQKCDYKSPHSHNFEAHIRMHNKEKPFKCKLCEKAFTQKVSCILHIRGHDDSYKIKCTVCEQLFLNEQSLIRHTKKAHDGIGYQRKKRIIK